MILKEAFHFTEFEYLQPNCLFDSDMTGADLVKKANRRLPKEFKIQSAPHGAYRTGHIYANASITSACKDLAHHIETPDMHVMIDLINHELDPMHNNPLGWTDFGVIIFTPEDQYALHLYEQIQCKGYKLPLILTNISAKKDKKFPNGLRLDYNYGVPYYSSKLLEDFTLDLGQGLERFLESDEQAQNYPYIRYSAPEEKKGLYVLRRTNTSGIAHLHCHKNFADMGDTVDLTTSGYVIVTTNTL